MWKSILIAAASAVFTIQAAQPPNIIFLLADDMGAADLGCFGSPVIKSPHLDQLAADGMKLTQCYAASPNCSPARTGILTGRSPYRVGMYDFARFKPMHIPKTETTIAEVLQDAGYATMFAGKWHCSGDFANQPNPGDHGFDHWYANKTNFGKDSKSFVRNGQPAPAKGWMSEVVVDETMQWLDKRDTKKPFMTMLWFSEPHTPVLAAPEFEALYDNQETQDAIRSMTFGGEHVARKPNLDKAKTYFGCVSMLDHHIGRLMKYLDDNNLRENTIVIFTSDNGPEHRTPTCFGSPGALRGAKGHMHEGGYRVPGVIRWPGTLKAGSMSAEPINGTDFLPSLASIGGAKVPTTKPIDGANVFPALINSTATKRTTPMMWWLWHARGGKEVTMRIGNYKILANMLPQPNPGNPQDTKTPADMSIMDFIKTTNLGNFELYNLKKDPNETTNLATTEPERLQQLRKQMIALHQEIRAEGPIYQLGKSKKKK